MTNRIIFLDSRIDQVLSGESLTSEERIFLIEDTPRFEECDFSKEDLSKMDDIRLMGTAYRVWADYTR